MKIANPYETCKRPHSLLTDLSKISCPESFFFNDHETVHTLYPGALQNIANWSESSWFFFGF